MLTDAHLSERTLRVNPNMRAEARHISEEAFMYVLALQKGEGNGNEKVLFLVVIDFFVRL
jgi:hypothetical protein